MKIVITGGHLPPALALIENLKNLKDIEIIFFGRLQATEGTSNLAIEHLEVSKSKVTFIPITTGRLQRKFTSRTIVSLLKVPIGFLESLYQLLKIRPNLVISFGSYQSVPVVFTAWLLGIDSISHEQATIPGLATKINSLFSNKVFVTWPQSHKYFSQGKFEVIGNLTRKSIFKKTASDPKIKNFLSKRNKTIYITGGNQGSHFLNGIVFEIQEILSDFQIIHQVGKTNYKGDLDKAKKNKKVNYLPLPYIDSQNIGAVYNRADLVVGRSGANTVWDLATLGKPAIFIPLPISASGEQQENAKVLKTAGSAEVISQEKATAHKIIKTIKKVFKDYSKYQKNAQDFSKKLPKQGTNKITSYVLKQLHAQIS